MTKKEVEKRENKKKLALKMYLEGMGFRAIGRLLGVSHVTVLNWIKQSEKYIKDSASSVEPVKTAELDEIHTYVQSKKSRLDFDGGRQEQKAFS